MVHCILDQHIWHLMLDVDPPVQILIVFILFTIQLRFHHDTERHLDEPRSDFGTNPKKMFIFWSCNSNRDWNTNLNLLLCQFDSIDEHAELLNDQKVHFFELLFQLFNFALRGYRLFTFPPTGAPIFEPRLTNKNVTCELIVKWINLNKAM